MATGNAPYGDIFLVQTPTLDRWGQQLYNEQRLRQVQQAQENQVLDQNVQKELGKVRSVDAPDIIKSYQDYKNIKQNLLFNNKLKRDPVAYNQLQQEANKAYSNIFSQATRSAELKDMQKELTTDRMKSPDSYSDDFGQRMGTLMGTPISQLSQAHPQFGDLTNWDNYRYAGSNTNWGEQVAKAAGTPTVVYSEPKTMDGGLQTQITPYSFARSPLQVKNYLTGVMAMHGAGRGAAYDLDHLPQGELEKTFQDYQQIPAQKWQRMGLSGPQDLMPKNPDSKADVYSSYLAMKYALSNEPTAGKPEFKQNLAAVKNWELNKDKIMAGVQHGYREDEIRLRDELKNSSVGEQDDKINDLYDNLKAYALKNKRPYQPLGGQPTTQYDIQVPDGVKKLFASKDNKGHTIYPDFMRFSKNFDEVTPLFLRHVVDEDGNRTGVIEKDPKTGKAAVNTDLSVPIPEPEFKERWKKELMGAEAYGASLKTKKAASKYTFNGKQYTHAELNQMGYDDNTIDQAIKRGLISK